MPVQRLPRYELLLNTLLEKTDSKHPDYRLLKRGLISITSITEKVDELIQKEENLQKSYVIQKKLGLVNFLFYFNLFLIFILFQFNF